jgi:hypothetical protein
MKSSKINISSRFKIVISLSQNKLMLIFCLQLFFINNFFAQTYEIDDGSVNGQTISVCTGTFYDEGGSGGDYTNNQNYSTTFCSDNGGNITLDFTTNWDLENNGSCSYDGLTIYDGIDNSATNLGTFCTNSPGIITSSGTCLHFEFYSDYSVVRSGWEAPISCSISSTTDTDGDGIADFIDQDDDNDGILDCVEKRLSNTPFNQVFTVNGDATQISSTELQITQDVLSQGSSAFANDRIDFNQDFSFSFEVYLGTNDSGADGLAIVFHNDPAGSSAIGTIGAGLSAEGIQDGIVLEIDTYDNGVGFGNGDISADHTMIWDSDNQTGAGLLTSAIGFSNLEDGTWKTVSITWDAVAQTISYTLDGVTAGSFTNDLVNNYFDSENLIYFGFSGSTGGLSNDQRIRFASGFCDFQVSIDDDNDGIENHLDLDSDNDGIYDAIEAGHGEALTNGRLTGAVGTNGVDDNVETAVDNNIPNYTLANTDGDAYADISDLDSDDDGCYDTIEEEINDSDRDGIAGTGAPSVDLNGLVTSITYVDPVNDLWQDASLQIAECTDTDGDLIPDIEDIDDDNDGILDYDELFCLSGTSTSATFSSLTEAWQSTGATMDAGKVYTLSPSGSSLGSTIVTGGPNDGLDVEIIQFAGNRFADLNGYGYYYAGNSIESLLRAPGAIGFANLTGTEYDYLLTFIGLIDVNSNGQYDVGIDQIIPRLFLEDNSIRFNANVTGDFYVVFTDSNYGDNSGIFSFTVEECVSYDTDGDGVFDYLDLDSDNDGIWDAVEAGHGESTTDGRITGDVGTNGFLDDIETSLDNGIIDYTISDSDSDGNYDAYELDSDNDTCNDSDEENISDSDSDGIAGNGVPVVDGNGLVTSITYSNPPSSNWQDPSASPECNTSCTTIRTNRHISRSVNN